MTPAHLTEPPIPALRLLPVEQARDLAQYQPETSIQDRIEVLAGKSSAGELTEAERAEYLGYVQANKFVAILQAQVRRRIAERS